MLALVLCEHLVATQKLGSRGAHAAHGAVAGALLRSGWCIAGIHRITTTTYSCTGKGWDAQNKDGGAQGAGISGKDSESRLQAAWRLAAADRNTTSSSGSVSTASAQETLAQMARALNILTGYDSVERLKDDVTATDQRLAELRRQLHAARSSYEERLSHQRSLSKEMSLLLQRKSSWGPSDVSRFTDVYASEHANDAAVAASKQRFEEAGEAVEMAQAELMQKIRERYTQEQLWSDKIRRAATWWTWGLMGLQAFSFVAVYAVMEPRRRALLQSAVGSLVEAQGKELREQLEELRGSMARLAGADGTSGNSISISSSVGSGSESRSGSIGSKGASLGQGFVQQQCFDQIMQELIELKKHIGFSGTVTAEQRQQQQQKPQWWQYWAWRQRQVQEKPVGSGEDGAVLARVSTPPEQQQPEEARQDQEAAADVALGSRLQGPNLLWRRAIVALQGLGERVFKPLLKGCPVQVTLTREQAAAAAAASAAAGGAVTLLLMALLSTGRGGSNGAGAAAL